MTGKRKHCTGVAEIRYVFASISSFSVSLWVETSNSPEVFSLLTQTLSLALSLSLSLWIWVSRGGLGFDGEKAEKEGWEKGEGKVNELDCSIRFMPLFCFTTLQLALMLKICVTLLFFFFVYTRSTSNLFKIFFYFFCGHLINIDVKKYIGPKQIIQ